MPLVIPVCKGKLCHNLSTMKGFEGIEKSEVKKSIGAEQDIARGVPVSPVEKPLFEADKPERSDIVEYFERVKESPEALSEILQKAALLALDITNIQADGMLTPEELNRVLPLVRVIVPKLTARLERVGEEERAAIEEFLLPFKDLLSKNEQGKTEANEQ